ncbi:MAG: type III-A CRISPR-associated RAMP protein Csm5 [Bacteroidota bacterium]
MANQKQNINLKVLSPVCIGNDQTETLSPYADFVISEDGDEVIYIDHAEFAFLLNERGKVQDFSHQIVENIDNNRSRFRLREYITDTLEADLDEVSRKRLPNFGIKHGERHQVKATLKSGGKPYISGSTLKGAIRTALLHHWLEEEPAGQHLLKQAYKTILLPSNQAKVKQLGELRFRKKSSRLNGYEFKRMKDLERELERLVKSLLDESQLFGDLRSKEVAPFSQLIQVSDSQSFSTSDMAVYQAQRVRLAPLGGRRDQRRKGGDIPQPREAIQSGSQSNFSVTLRPGIEKFGIKNLGQNHPRQLLEIIRTWSKACIGLELDHLDQAYDMPSKPAKAALSEFYGKMYDQAKSGKIFLRLGQGKTYYENSLGVALLNYADKLQQQEGEDQLIPEQFRKFRKMALDVSLRSDLFPITRSITTIGHQPMGWVELSV